MTSSNWFKAIILSLILITLNIILTIWAAQYLPAVSKLDGTTPITASNNLENYLKNTTRLWDTAYYRDNAQYGYHPNFKNHFAFFPLFSGQIWLFNRVIPNLDWAVLLSSFMNLVLLIYFLLVFYQKFQSKYPEFQIDSFYSLLFGISLPFTFYFFFPYTESLFAWLLVATITILEFEPNWKIGFLPVITLGLSLTRSVGLFSLLILFIYFVFEIFKHQRNWIKIAVIPLAMITTAAGLFGFMLFGQQMTGNFWISSNVQENWGRKPTTDLTAEFAHTARCLVSNLQEPKCENIVYRRLGYEVYPWIALILIILTLGMAIYVFRKQKPLIIGLSAYSLAALLLPLTTTVLDSYYRYAMLTPVYFILLPIILTRYLNPNGKAVLLAVLVAIQAVFIVLFANGYWIV
ncbi:MAG: hypothetical protein OHK0017_04950 [Patescibacteria group bacterium]